MEYKVCILAAGTGTRLGELSSQLNKAVLPVNNKAVISYIVEKFPDNIEIIITLGHKKETVRDYLTLAYPEKKFTFVEIDKYVGPGTGPGYSLLQCKDYLQCPFIFVTADTIVREEVPVPDHNWLGIAPVKETQFYCTARIKDNSIYHLDDKTKNDNKYASIGLAGVYDYKPFFDSLENDKEIIEGEIQVSNGFKKLIDYKLVPIGFTWFDTGNIENYTKTNKELSEQVKFDFGKSDEYIYFVNGKVIKYFADPKITQNRYQRATDNLNGLCPKMDGIAGNFYAYKKVNGQTLYSVLNVKTVRDFLQWTKVNLWKKLDLSLSDRKAFKKLCKDFYFHKTQKRLQMFYDKSGLEDTENLINGMPIPPIKDMFSRIDWDYITAGIPSNFHGDLQFDNVLVTHDDKSNLEKFMLLDWRQDFAGVTNMGDLYYDLAKLYGGTIISYQLIKEGMFTFDMSGSSVYFNFFLKNDLLEAKTELESFIIKNGYDLNKIKIITSLIFLNMSPLHNNPFDLTLYYFGKSMLFKSLENI